jgi:enoyl-[acyl-carrier protein] reductase/trans-2-enoyl-CoA reductase (NAD+)
MKARGTHEGPIEQMIRLFDEHLAPGQTATTDVEGRIRLDDLEMDPAVQAEVKALWDRVDDALLAELGGFERFQAYFRELFGFDLPGVDYALPVEIDLPLE